MLVGSHRVLGWKVLDGWGRLPPGFPCDTRRGVRHGVSVGRLGQIEAWRGREWVSLAPL